MFFVPISILKYIIQWNLTFGWCFGYFVCGTAGTAAEQTLLSYNYKLQHIYSYYTCIQNRSIFYYNYYILRLSHKHIFIV